MNQIPLGPTGRETTRLGYGCSRLMGSIGRKESVALLESAYDAGIRHFDVAPAYGAGQAEVCVGEFLTRHRADVTVATKYGVPVHDHPGLKLTLRRLAMPLIERVPGLKQRLQRAQLPAAGPGTPGPREFLPFVPELIRASIENSLRLLKTDRIDLFLLHEVVAADLADDGILRLLEDFQTAGAIGVFGCASGYDRIVALTQLRPAYCQIAAAPVVRARPAAAARPLPHPAPFAVGALHRTALRPARRQTPRQALV